MRMPTFFVLGYISSRVANGGSLRRIFEDDKGVSYEKLLLGVKGKASYVIFYGIQNSGIRIIENMILEVNTNLKLITLL